MVSSYEGVRIGGSANVDRDDFHFGPKTQKLMAKELAQYLMRP